VLQLQSIHSEETLLPIQIFAVSCKKTAVLDTVFDAVF